MADTKFDEIDRTTAFERRDPWGSAMTAARGDGCRTISEPDVPGWR